MARGTKSKSKQRSRTPAALKPVASPVSTATARGAAPGTDVRRWIYGGLDLAFAILQAILIWKVVPNRLPSASFHLWTLPILTFAMGIGTLMGGRRGWWIAVVSGSAALFSTILLIVRIVVSAAFLSGVYGAFGKAAAMTALMSVALLVEMVALLPIVQVKYLMTRAGRRNYDVPSR
jgi:hypothetical protein